MESISLGYPPSKTGEKMGTLLIKNGDIYDGTGRPWYSADVFVKEDRIHRIGKIGNEEADVVVNASGLAVAFAHLLFNIYGTGVFWPLKWIPVSLAKGYEKLAARRRLLAAAYILIIFFIVPIVIIILFRPG